VFENKLGSVLHFLQHGRILLFLVSDQNNNFDIHLLGWWTVEHCSSTAVVL